MDFSDMEKKWQKKWETSKIWAVNTEDKSKPHFFMHFAYPTVSGYQHVGHMRGYSCSDIITRYKRMKGYNVFFPIGSHASGNGMLGFAKKVEKGDKKWIEYLIGNGYPQKELDKMKEPLKAVDYFNENYKENWKIMGFLPDWDSFTCTIFPDYGKFIQWQFKKLKDKGLLIQKPYFATFCLSCGPVSVDPAEMDISKGGTAEKHEYTLIKFKLDDKYLVAATLRPETMYGQTNLWVEPNAEYVEIKVKDGTHEEMWVCSEPCAKKLENQKDKVKIVGKIKGKDLVGKYAYAPKVERKIIILPSKFCEQNVGTGIVTSVPSDAPDDWMGLYDLQRDKKECEKYGLDYDEIKSMKVIPIIDSKDLGDTPAVKVCDELGIKNQNDPKLKEAKKIVYSKGFYTGIMNKNCGEYAGQQVEKAKELVKQSLIDSNQASTMYDLSEEVICRCGERVVIKKVPDQWFINYADEELTKKSLEHVKEMNISPQDYKENMPKIISWFQERAAARLGTWLGTKFPFDERWTIEPISDSTLYSAYYVVSRYFNKGKIKLEDMDESFFDYVFLGKGKPKHKVWDEIKKDFDYLYPVDINLGGKEHMTVHFPVYVMNHVAIMKEKNWPKGILAHYYIVEQGGKISKSKGGASTIPKEAVSKYSADALRLYYAHIASLFVDVAWDENMVMKYKNQIEKIFLIQEQLVKDNSKNENNWIISRLYSRIKEANSAMNEYDLRRAVDVILFEFIKDINKYIKKGTNKKTSEEVLSVWLRALTPFIPHTTEELWEKSGFKGLVSSQSWPVVDESKINFEYEASEDLITQVTSDIREVSKLLGKEPKEVTIFVADDWKYEFVSLLKKEIKEGNRDFKKILSKIPPGMKTHMGDITKIIPRILKDESKLPSYVLTSDKEFGILKGEKTSIEKELSTKLKIVKESDSKEPKAKQSFPSKPGILFG